MFCLVPLRTIVLVMSASIDSNQENLEPDVFSSMCTSRGTLQHLTGRWGSLTIVALLECDSEMRFAELRRKIDGISDRMLSQTLGQLERDGMVVRHVRSSIPPHVNYSLTVLGKKVAQPLHELTKIIEADLGTVMEAQQRFDSKQ